MIAVAEAPRGADPFTLALQDGVGCLRYLLSAGLPGGGTAADVIAGRPIAHLSVRRLRTMGVALEPAPRSLFCAVATAHPALSDIFAPTLWIGDWASALLTLPGATRFPPLLFGRVYAGAVLVPRSLLVETAA